MTFGTNDLIKRNNTVPEPKLITLALLDPNKHPDWFKWGNMSFIIQGFMPAILLIKLVFVTNCFQNIALIFIILQARSVVYKRAIYASINIREY